MTGRPKNLTHPLALARESERESKMSSSVTYVNDFTTDNIVISPPKVLESGAKQAYLNYSGGRLVMQSATNLSVPFGLSVYDKSGPAEYSIDISYRGHESNPEIKQFFDAMSALDNFMIDQGVRNSRAWFKSELNREVVKAFYTPCVKFAKDKDGNPQPYPPTTKLKLRKINGEFEAKFYDVKGNPYKGVPVEDLLVKGVQVTVLMECAGVWFAGSKFGLTWRAKQVVIHRLPERLPEFAAFRLGSTTDDEPAHAPAPRRTASSAPPPQSYDDEVDDDEALRPPPAKASVLSAVMPQAPAPTPVPSGGAGQESSVDDEAEDIEPAPVPKKPIIKKKPVVVGRK